MFINLHNHSEYSVLDGMLKIEQLVQFAKKHNQPAIALTDHGSLGGIYRFYKLAKKEGIKPIFGVEAYVVDDVTIKERKMRHLLLLAKNQRGLEGIIKLSNRANREGFYYKPRIQIDWLLEYRKDLIVSNACLYGILSQHLLYDNISKAYEVAKTLKKIFPYYYIEIMPHNLPEQKKVNLQLIKLAENLDIPLITTIDAHYIKEEKNSHKIFLQIQSNNENFEFGLDTFYLMDDDEIINLYKQNHPEISEEIIIKSIENTHLISKMVENVQILKINEPIPPVYSDLTSKEEEYVKLLALTGEGWLKRGIHKKPNRQEYEERLNYELSVIKKQGFVRYFLAVHDIYANFVIPNNIMYGVGRGSAAGSLVSYLLGIVDIDPIQFGLLFERFISPNRVTNPDIDMDFEDERRDEIFDYLKEKYGKNNFVRIGTYGTLHGKSAFKDVARIFGVSFQKANKLSEKIIAGSENAIEDAYKNDLEFKDFMNKHPEIYKHARALEGKIRQTGIHACGVLITPDGEIDKNIPIERRKNEIVTAFEGAELEELGYLKLDLLGLKTMTVIRKTLEQIGKTREFLLEIPIDDKKVLEEFNKGNTNGVFQFSGDGIQKYLRETPIDSFYDLIAINALYRPSGLGSGMASDFTERKKTGLVPNVHPIYDEITKETLGLIVYQEQIMEIFRRIGNYPPSDVDMMRKKIAKSYGVEELEKERGRFLKGAKQNNVPEDIANDLFNKMIYFGGYGFNKSHATAYTMIAYWTMYLKVYYPLEFLIASLNSESNDSKILELLEEAENYGYKITLPKVNISKTEFSVYNGTINYGLKYLKGLGKKAAKLIEEMYPVKDRDDFMKRKSSKVNKRIIEILDNIKFWDIDNQSIELKRFAIKQRYISHPVLKEDLNKLFKKLQTSKVEITPIKKLDYNKADIVTIAGVIKEIEIKKMTKNTYKWKKGDRYALVTITDLSNSGTFKFNPEQYEMYKEKLNEGNYIIILGNINSQFKMLEVIKAQIAEEV